MYDIKHIFDVHERPSGGWTSENFRVIFDVIEIGSKPGIPSFKVGSILVGNENFSVTETSLWYYQQNETNNSKHL